MCTKLTAVSDGYLRLRIREKECANCLQSKATLFRCRYENLAWLFLCEECLVLAKREHENTYVYGGTWKGKKK